MKRAPKLLKHIVGDNRRMKRGEPAGDMAKVLGDLDAVKDEDVVRTFRLLRDKDISGMSGTGVVAHGAQFPDGLIVLRWRGRWPTSAVFHEGIASVEAVHGHGGATRIVWDER